MVIGRGEGDVDQGWIGEMCEVREIKAQEMKCTV